MDLEVLRREVEEGVDEERREDEWRVKGKKEEAMLTDKVEARQSKALEKEMEKIYLEIKNFLLELLLKRELDIKNIRTNGNNKKVVNGADNNAADYNGADYNGDGNYDGSGSGSGNNGRG